jgi:hypothetical protein
MATTVEPSEFRMVDFDAQQIADLTDELARRVGLGGDVDIRIEVDETTPAGRTEVVSLDPLHIRTESGSFENPKRLRQFSEESATDVLGRYLLRAADRRRDGFGDAPSDEDLTVPQRTAWEVYAVGRMARLGYPVRRQRWLYAFRNRYGFTDTADDAFERLWDGDELTWSEIDQLSEATAATNPGPLER